VELERYQALLCAIETGSLTAAADTLGYTPSGMSRMMAALESEHGFQLLLRGKNGVIPTQECQRMLPLIRELLFCGEKLEQLSGQIRSIDVGSFTIGTAYSYYYSWLSKVVSDFHKTYPNIQIKMISGYSSDLLQKIQEHQIDAAIISQREGSHIWIPIQENNMVAMVPKGHPLEAEGVVPLESFVTEPYINTYPGFDIDNHRIFSRYQIVPNTHCSTMDIYATYSMVEAGLGISMDNELNCYPWRDRISLLPLNPPQTVHIGFALSENQTPAAKRFFEFIQPYISKLAEQTMTTV